MVELEEREMRNEVLSERIEELEGRYRRMESQIRSLEERREEELGVDRVGMRG